MEVQTFTRVKSEDKPERTAVLRMVSKADIIPTIIMLLVGRAEVSGMFPFVCAYFAASFDKRVGYLGIFAMLCGLVSAGEGLASVRYVFAAVVFWLYSYIREDKKNVTMSALICGGGVLICGGMFLPYTEPTVYGMLRLFSESVLTGFLYIAFSRASMLVRGRGTRTQIGKEELICLAICTGGVINGFSGIALPFGVEIVHILTMYTVGILTLYASMGTAVISTVLVAICTAANMENALFLVGLYALCAIFASMLRTFGRLGTTVGIVGGGILGLLFTGSVFAFPVQLSELAISAAAIVITPKRVMSDFGSFLSRTLRTEALGTDLRIKGYICERLDKMSESYKSLEEGFEEMYSVRREEERDTVGELFDDVADHVCRSCGMCHECWQKNFDATYEKMYEMLATIEERGYCDRANVPKGMGELCVRLDTMIAEFSHRYELFKNRAMWKNDNERVRKLMARQYGELSQVLGALSCDLRGGFTFVDEEEEKLIERLDEEGFRVREISVIENGVGNTEVFVRPSCGTNLKALCSRVSEIMELPMELREQKNGRCRLVSRCEYTVEVGVCCRAKTGSTRCGDSIIHFMTDDNKYCVAVCDGMGSGETAQRESRFSSELLKKLICAGISNNMAVELINASMTGRSTDESFSTIDIFVFDMMNGVCSFIKIGGAESYICTREGIEVIFSKTLPVGMLNDVCADTVKRRLRSGDVVVLATDGVTESFCGDRLREELREGAENVDELACKLVDAAAACSGGVCRDDMSVAAVRIKRAV